MVKSFEIKMSKQVAIRKVISDRVISFKVKQGVNRDNCLMITRDKNALIEAIRDGIITAIKFYDSFGLITQSYID